MDKQCYTPGSRLTLKIEVAKHFLFPAYFIIQVKNNSSLPVALASVNLVARAKAIPLRIQAKPSTYRTKLGPCGQMSNIELFSRFSKKCWYSRPPLWPSLTSYSFKLPATLPSSSTSSCIEAKSSLFLNKNNEIFHKHEFVPQVSPEYQTLHLHRTFAQDSAALSGTTKFTFTYNSLLSCSKHILTQHPFWYSNI